MSIPYLHVPATRRSAFGIAIHGSSKPRRIQHGWFMSIYRKPLFFECIRWGVTCRFSPHLAFFMCFLWKMSMGFCSPLWLKIWFPWMFARSNQQTKQFNLTPALVYSTIYLFQHPNLWLQSGRWYFQPHDSWFNAKNCCQKVCCSF